MTVAADFMEWLRPGEPWVLTAIDKDKKTIETITVSTAETLDDFVETHEGKRNQYYNPNRMTKPVSKKPGRVDVKSVDFLQIDLDPRAGEDVDEEAVRLIALAKSKPPQGLPPPSYAIFSGGGVQLGWRLEEPIQINGDVALAKEAERYNLRLIELYDDPDRSCFDCCHLLRLPGTTNVPDAGKRKKGRTPKLATLLYSLSERVYPLGKFAKAAPVAEESVDEGREAFEGKASKLPHIDDLDEWHVFDIIKRMIQTGEKAGEENRSDIVLHVCGALVRHSVPDALIFGIITNKRWGISAHCRAQKDTKRAALRAMEKAHQNNPSNQEKLVALNERHFVLGDQGAKCLVASWTQSEVDPTRECISLQSFDAIKNRYLNKFVMTWNMKKGQYTGANLGKAWLQWPGRREYLAMRFDPSKPVEFDGFINLWRGFAVEPKAGTWKLMRDHIERVGGKDHGYIIKWMAWSVQNPDKPAEVAIAIRGRRGCGKGTVGNTFIKLFGQHGLQISSVNLISGQFNEHLRDTCALFYDEAYAVGDKQGEAALKTHITEQSVNIEGKGLKMVPIRNMLHIVIAGNDEWLIPAGVEERRFAIFDCPPKPENWEQYFKALYHELDNGGREAMLHDLLAMDLGDWHPRGNVPQTAALDAQKAQGDSDELQWLLGALEDGMIGAVKPRNKNAPARAYLSGKHPSSITNRMKDSAPGLRNVSDQRLTKFLKDWDFVGGHSGPDTWWTAPSLIALRKQFDERVRVIRWADSGVEGWRDREPTAEWQPSNDDEQGQIDLEARMGR